MSSATEVLSDGTLVSGSEGGGRGPLYSCWQHYGDREFSAVVAIDFGTSGTGMLIGLRNIHTGETVVEYPDWTDHENDGRFTKEPTRKVPSCVLFSPDRKFHAFGNRARQLFQTGKSVSGEHIDQEWLYFAHFKMCLARFCSASLLATAKIQADNGKELPLKFVITAVLRYLSERALCCLNPPQLVSAAAAAAAVAAHHRSDDDDDDKYGRPILAEKVRWVLTVPAVWTEAAKQIMRECAKEAGMGIDRDQCVLLYEPEAAAVALHQEWSEELSEVGSLMNNGDRYMIVDCGGGTVDIVTHEWIAPFTVSEVLVPTGGSWGSHCIDDRIVGQFKEMFGASKIDELRRANPCVWAELVAACVKAKEMFHHQRAEEDDTLLIDGDFKDFGEDSTDDEGDQKYEPGATDAEKHFITLPQSFVRGMGGAGYLRRKVRDFGTDVQIVGAGELFLCLPEQWMCAHFWDVISNITEKLRTLITEEWTSLFSRDGSGSSDGCLKFVCLVGGFANSRYLVRSVRKVLAECAPIVRVIVAKDPESAVMRGAANLEHHRRLLAMRMLRHSYGICKNVTLSQVLEWDNPPTDDELTGRIYESSNESHRGMPYVRNVFTLLIKQGTLVRPGHIIEEKVYARSADQRTMPCSLRMSRDCHTDHLLPMSAAERKTTAVFGHEVSVAIPAWFDCRSGYALFKFQFGCEVELTMSVSFHSNGRSSISIPIKPYYLD